MRLLCCLLLLCLSPRLISQEGTSILTSTWDIRQDVHELYGRITVSPQPDIRLFDDIEATIREHGAALVGLNGSWKPAYVHLLDALREKQLLHAYEEHISPAAQRALDQVDPFSEAGLQQTARTYPGSAAAHSAWLRLADLAWDRGYIGHYLRYDAF